MRNNSLTLLRTKDAKHAVQTSYRTASSLSNSKSVCPKLMIASPSLRVIVERNTDSAAMVTVILPDDQFALQFPESGVVI